MCDQPSQYISAEEFGEAFGTPKVTDPVQGYVLENCSLIAAFASLAWKLRISTQTGDSYAFTFHKLDEYNNVIGETQHADNTLPADSTGKLMHARSDDPAKYWPPLYEKAYYMWLAGVGLTNEAGKPDYCQFAGGQNAVTVFFQLTGMWARQKTSTTNAGDVFKTADTVFADIEKWCNNFARLNTERIIKTPAVAWTYDNSPLYSGSGIVNKHTYSLLGVTGTRDARDASVWIEKYIVLRNPFGKVAGDLTGSVSAYTPIRPWCNINIADVDGIFAISAADFFKYFAGYAWTPG